MVLNSVLPVDSKLSDLPEYHRFNLELEACIQLENGVKIEGKTGNLSYKGTFIKLPDTSQLNQGDTCALSIIVSERPEPQILKLPCTIRFVRDDGVGLEIISDDSKEYHDYVLLLASYTPSPDALLEEIISHSIDHINPEDLS